MSKMFNIRTGLVALLSGVLITHAFNSEPVFDVRKYVSYQRPSVGRVYTRPQNTGKVTKKIGKRIIPPTQISSQYILNE